MPATPHSPRILIVRLSAMGDVVHAMPAVTALRRQHPDAFIAWAIEPAWAPLLAAGPSRPLVDRIHEVPFKSWLRSPLSATTIAAIRKTRHDLVDGRYDIAIDLQGNLRSAITLSWSGALRRIGEDAPRERVARCFYRERIHTSGSHVIEQDLEVASAVNGNPLACAIPPFPIDAEADRWAAEAIARHPAQRYAVLLPGAGWGAKRWPPQRYGAVAAALLDDGFHSFINVGPGEEELGRIAEESSRGAAHPLATTLSQLIALLRRTSLCVGGDTGPLHLACALRVPCIGLYGPTDPARNGPFLAPSRVLRHPASRRDHARKSQPDAGLLTITPQDVLAAVKELLAGIATAPADSAAPDPAPADPEVRS